MLKTKIELLEKSLGQIVADFEKERELRESDSTDDVAASPAYDDVAKIADSSTVNST